MGGTEQLITDDSVNKRVKFYNCEMLKRPRIAMSELAQTTSETLDCLSQIKKPVIPAATLEEIKIAVKPLSDAVAPLLIKEGTSQADDKNVKAAVRFFLEPNDKLDKTMNKIYVTASNLLTLSTQYLVNKSLLTNPDMFADKVNATEVSDVDFKNGKDVRSMKKFMIMACTAGKKKGSAVAKKNLLEAFDSSSDDEVDNNKSSSEESDDSSSEESSHSSREKSETSAEKQSNAVYVFVSPSEKGTKRKHKQLIEPISCKTEESTEDVAEEEEIQPKKHNKSKKNKHT